MGFLVSLLAPRLGAGFAKLIAYVVVPLLIIGIIWWRVDAWGDRRFDQGKEFADTQWEEAGRKARAEAAESASRADDLAVRRVEEFKAQSEGDRKAVEDAKASGSSPIDALFGS